MKETRTNGSSRQRFGYNSPSVRVINIGMRQAVLQNVSDTETLPTQDI